MCVSPSLVLLSSGGELTRGVDILIHSFLKSPNQQSTGIYAMMQKNQGRSGF